MTKYERTRRAIIGVAPLISALSQLALWIMVAASYAQGNDRTFWASAALLAILKLGEINENLERRN